MNRNHVRPPTNEHGFRVPLDSDDVSQASLPLLLTDDHLSRLTWLGLDLDASPDEVARALVHHALDDPTTHSDVGSRDALVGALVRLRGAS